MVKWTTNLPLASSIDDPSAPAFIEVPKRIMRSLRWGKLVRVVATINGHSYHATIRNVGFGPSFAVSQHARSLARIHLNEFVAVAISERSIS